MAAPALLALLGAGATAPAFDPFSLGWELALWGDDPDWSNPGDGNAVSTWRDGSGNTRDLTGSGTARPLFRSSVSAFNDHAAVDFDGVNDILQSASFTTVSQPFSVVVVVKRDGDGSGGFERGVCQGDGNWVGTAAYRTSGKWAMYGGAAIGSSSVSYDSNAHAIRHLFNGASSRIVVDSTSTSVSVGTDGFVGGLKLGASNSLEYGNQHYAFVGLYAGDVTADGDWADFVAWVDDYYGLTLG